MTGKIKIVNGNVIREGEDIESGAGRNTSCGENNNVNNSNNQNVNNISIYHKGAVAFLVSVAVFGMGVAFPVLMLIVLYNVYKTSSNSSSSFTLSRLFNSNNTATRRNNNGNGGSNIRTVSDLPKPPPSA